VVPETGAPAAARASGDDPEHERFFYLTDEDFVQRQAASQAFDDFEVTPRPAPVAPTHRRRLRRVVGYAMGTASVLFMVGVGHVLGRGMLTTSAGDTAASTRQAAMPGGAPNSPSRRTPSTTSASAPARGPATPPARDPAPKAQPSGPEKRP
jgi:hypothetical protein